jgi:hypothetical protein
MKSLKKYFFIPVVLLGLSAVPVVASADVYYRTGYCGVGGCGYRVAPCGYNRCGYRVVYRHRGYYSPCHYRHCGGCGYGYRHSYRWGW